MNMRLTGIGLYIPWSIDRRRVYLVHHAQRGPFTEELHDGLYLVVIACDSAPNGDSATRLFLLA